ncbi:S8 family peptidase [Paenibacillus flagellatus]|uniref:Peptidase S8 n=1 Tax=Paenibacillus flagellatus TaxID=2211139 RepID=A0A2V5JY03_9BACL|nr:S8 family peptidase [Paenibacillus flagellatus]PYI51745.1 peptidase S8 [Paenibacillus flagellatus]
MWKKVASASFIIVCALFLFSSANRTRSPDSANPSPERELQIKQSMLERDVSMTEQLCRTQCSLDFKETLHQLKPGSTGDVKSALDDMRSHHKHMEYLEWSGPAGTAPVGSGHVPESVREPVEKALDEARKSVKAGKPYQSDKIGEGGEQQYVVMGEPSADGSSSLVGLVHQDILQKVAIDARKNLRIVPYPSDKRWKIESVDSNTLKDVKVDHPEDNEGTSHYHVNQIVVKFRREPTEAELKQIVAEIGASSKEKLGYTYVFESSHMEAKQLMDYFQKWNVEYAEPHFLYLTNEAVEPNDMLYSRYQWNLPAIETVPGWDVTRGSEEVVVAVVDTGVDLNHPDLNGRTVEGINIVSPNSLPMDDVGHGTHVAGVISALVNNREGVAGMSWYNRVMPVKVLDETGAGSTYSVAQGIIWATDHGAKVINMSLGNYADAQFLHDAVRYAYDRDVVLIAASGNDNTERPGYPAAYPEVFAVAATDANNQKASFSNYGDYIDVAAPGVNIASTYPDNHYAALSGTSMASPHVTALAALIRSVNPLLTNEEVMDIMRRTANDIGDSGKDRYYGYGQIDVVKAVSQAAQTRESLTFWPEWFEREAARLARKYKES